MVVDVPEGDGRRVTLVLLRQVESQLGGLPNRDHQNTAGYRVERASVTDRVRVERLRIRADHIVAGGSDRLVDDEDAVS